MNTTFDKTACDKIHQTVKTPSLSLKKAISRAFLFVLKINKKSLYQGDSRPTLEVILSKIVIRNIRQHLLLLQIGTQDLISKLYQKFANLKRVQNLKFNNCSETLCLPLPEALNMDQVC